MNLVINHQPDDPGTEQNNPYAPLTFEVRGIGGQAAMLGGEEFGMVQQHPRGTFGANAYWTCVLTRSRQHPATSVVAAKRKLAQRAHEWLARIPRS